MSQPAEALAVYNRIYHVVEEFCEQVYHGLLFDEGGYFIPDQRNLSQYAAKFRSFLADQKGQLAALQAQRQPRWGSSLFTKIEEHLDGLVHDIDLLNRNSASCLADLRRSGHYNFFWKVVAHPFDVNTVVEGAIVPDVKGRLGIICKLAGLALFCLCFLPSISES